MADDIQIQKMDGKSLDVTGVNKEKLKTVFPECFTEGNLDIDKLLSLCGEYIDNDFEKYKFEWKGKSECYRIAGKRSTGTLRPCPEESVDFENTNNLYIEGDNLEVLKLLQTAYYRKVKMIYIDPPYNTGNDFVYEDDFKDPMAKYKEITSQTTKSNPETMGRYHTNWLNMMYPRLRLASNLLRDDGVIFISIDEREIDNLKKVCNEVFGEENFIGSFVWRKKDGGGQAKEYFAIEHEYIVVYRKTEQLYWIDKTEERNISQYNKKDERGNFKVTKLAKWGNTARREDRPSMYFPLIAPDGKEAYPIAPDGNDGRWRVGKERMNELKSLDLIYWDKKGDRWIPYEKEYFDNQVKVIKKRSILYDVANTGDGSNVLTEMFGRKDVFENPKPLEVIREFVESSSENDDIVLDFFSGSATTAHAVMQLNAEDGGKRQFIMVQLPEVTDEKSEAFKAGYKNICEIGKERIRRAGSKIKEQNADVDVGFKVLKLDTSNLVKWDDTPVSETEVLRERFDSVVKTLKFDRSELDVVYEVMLKLGIPVTYKVNLTDINGRKVYSIGEDGLILVCLDGSNGGITPEDISAMCDLTPAKIVAAEEAFKDDVALSNAYYISKDKGVEIELL
ncbi:MAG: site-specific DNA-methyltransferase [Alphaproteobacteria bacterium]|nr:site-specific DNA-methyltransferase [Alphaproteobacteria bacterium]